MANPRKAKLEKSLQAVTNNPLLAHMRAVAYAPIPERVEIKDNFSAAEQKRERRRLRNLGVK